MWKVAVVAKFRVLPQNLCSGTKAHTHGIVVLAQNWNQVAPLYRSELLPLEPSWLVITLFQLHEDNGGGCRDLLSSIVYADSHLKATKKIDNQIIRDNRSLLRD
jgi:hypothetical protein